VPKPLRMQPRQTNPGGPLGDDPEDARGLMAPLRPELALVSAGATLPLFGPHCDHKGGSELSG
jgi:hypothetical protein